jgi:hypothetical protein
MNRARWIAALVAAVALVVGGAWVGSRYDLHVVNKSLTQADQQDRQGTASATQGASHDQAAAAQQPTLQADAEAVSRSRTEVARVRATTPRPAPVPPTPGVPNPEPAGAPVETPLEAAQGHLIDALTKENTDLKAQNAELTAARDSWREAAGQFKAETASLRTVIAHTPKPRPLAVGVLVGTNRSFGAWVEYDLGPVRVGADVVCRPAVTLGQKPEVEAIGRIGWRFRS